MAKIPVYQKCWRCKGDGVAELPTGEGDNIEDPCIVCNGDGYYPIFYLDITDLSDNVENILDKCNDILDKCNDILEKVNI